MFPGMTIKRTKRNLFNEPKQMARVKSCQKSIIVQEHMQTKKSDLINICEVVFLPNSLK